MKKKVLLVSMDVTSGLTWQRGHLFFRHLTDEFDVIPLSLHEVDKVHPMYVDAIVLMHPSHPEHTQAIARWKGHYSVPVIIDSDDLIEDMPSDHPEFAAFRGCDIAHSCLVADHVVVSTEFLKLKRAHLNLHTTVIENAVDERRMNHLGVEYDVTAKPYHRGFVVGWTGGQSHRPDIHSNQVGFIDGLSRLMDKYPNVRAYFHVLCPQELLSRFGSRVIFNETVVDFLDVPALYYTFPFDVCCVPLQDHPFNHAKSDLRLIDMAPYNIPLVASPTTDFARHRDRDIMTYAEDGKWYQALEDAYLNRALTRERALRAREYVMNHRTARALAEKWRAVLRESIRRGPSMEPVGLCQDAIELPDQLGCDSASPSPSCDKESRGSAPACGT
jgi:hypothetical protein